MSIISSCLDTEFTCWNPEQISLVLLLNKAGNCLEYSLNEQHGNS